MPTTDLAYFSAFFMECNSKDGRATSVHTLMKAWHCDRQWIHDYDG